MVFRLLGIILPNEKLHYECDGDVAVLTMDGPAGNALSVDLRGAALAALARAEADPAVVAIVLEGAGGTFSSGAQALSSPQSPTLNELCEAVELSAKPVVAALRGAAFGPGAALALAARARLASRRSQIGLPDVQAGLVPGGGATQRLARLAGASAALDLMLSGRPIGAIEAQRLGLVDEVIKGNPRAAAVTYARQIAADPPPRGRDRRAGLEDGVAFMGEVAKRRGALASSRLMAPGRIVDCVETAAMLPFEAGLAFEAAAQEDCRASQQAAALAHVRLAEERAAAPVGFDTARAREVGQIGIVGLGAVGAGVAIACLDAGLSVAITDRNSDAVVRGHQQIEQFYRNAVQRGTLSPGEREARLSRLVAARGLAGLSEADLVIEALPGAPLETKVEILDRIIGLTRPETIFASADPFADLGAIAGELEEDGARLLGLHFFAPVPATRLVELARTDVAAPETLATGLRFVQRLGKVALPVAARPGLVVFRLLEAARRAGDAMALEGASVEAVDAALRDFGLPLGPFQAADAVNITARSEAGLAPLLAVAGRRGRGSGKGYYLHEAGAPPRADDDVARLIIEARPAPARPVPDGEIRLRVLSAMANEGARILSEGGVAASGEIDLAMVLAVGFPRWRGGPMFAMSRAGGGVLGLRNRLRGWVSEAEGAGEPEWEAFWTPAPMLSTMVKHGRHFG